MKRLSSPAGDASRKVSSLLTTLALSALLAGAPLSSPRAQTSATQSAEITAVVEDVPGLRRTVFDTPHGKLFLNLPGEADPDSVVTGTLFAEPAGLTAAEREKNADVLRRYAVEVSGKRFAPGQVHVAVRDATNVVVNVPKDLKLKPKSVALKPPDPPADTPKEFSLPGYGQAGGFLLIRGPFDGEVADSDYVSVGDQRALTLAESSSAKVVLNNSDFAGVTRLEVKEQGRVVGGEYRNLSVGLAVTKPKTTSGEQSTLIVRVGGLGGLTYSVPLVIENRSTAVVRMERGDRESLIIRPADVQPDGTFTQTRQLTSLRPGAFTINATVIAQDKEGAPQPRAALSGPAAHGGAPLPPHRGGRSDDPPPMIIKLHLECGGSQADFVIDTDGGLLDMVATCKSIGRWVRNSCGLNGGTVSVKYTIS